jgi:hypothetical protein
LGLGARFLAAVEDATALAYPLTGTPASENTRRMFLKDFPFPLCTDLMKMNSCLCTCSSRTPPRVLAEPHRCPLTSRFRRWDWRLTSYPQITCPLLIRSIWRLEQSRTCTR